MTHINCLTKYKERNGIGSNHTDSHTFSTCDKLEIIIFFAKTLNDVNLINSMSNSLLILKIAGNEGRPELSYKTIKSGTSHMKKRANILYRDTVCKVSVQDTQVYKVQTITYTVSNNFRNHSFISIAFY